MAEQSSLVRLQDELDVNVDWRGFELHPETPGGGRPISELFPAERVAGMREYLRRFAEEFGVRGMVTPERLPNTRRALAIAELAEDEGKLDAFRGAAMDAYWREGKDLENADGLRAIARSAGLDPEAALRASEDPRYLERVKEIGEEAARIGVTGVPTFIFGEERVVGCQRYEVLARVARAAGAQAKKARPE